MGFPGGMVVKNPPANAGVERDLDQIPGSGRFPGVGNGNLPGKFHGWDPGWPQSWGHKQLDMTERQSMCTPTHIILIIPISYCSLLVHWNRINSCMLT